MNPRARTCISFHEVILTFIFSSMSLCFSLFSHRWEEKTEIHSHTEVTNITTRLILSFEQRRGWRGIRTPGIPINTSVFKTDSFNRSDIHPLLLPTLIFFLIQDKHRKEYSIKTRLSPYSLNCLSFLDEGEYLSSSFQHLRLTSGVKRNMKVFKISYGTTYLPKVNF